MASLLSAFNMLSLVYGPLMGRVLGQVDKRFQKKWLVCAGKFFSDKKRVKRV